MALGPALIISALGLLALATAGKKTSGGAAQAGDGLAPPLPPGPPSGGSLPPGMKKVEGPVPIMLPNELADLMTKALKDLTVQDNGQILGPVSPEAVQRATTVAAQIESAGFPDAAAGFRVYIQMAARKVASPPPDKQVSLPGVAPDVVAQVNRALQMERDPTKLQAILNALKNLPQSTQRDNLIEMLTQTIQQVQAALVMAETLRKTDEVLKSPGLPQPATAPTPTIELPTTEITASPPAPAAPPASVDVPDSAEKRRAINTANHLRNVVADAGGDVKKAKGKEDKSLVSAFQRGESITADGKSGPGTTLKMAKYTGDIPYVFYWPTSATAKNVLTYRETLRSMADQHESSGRTDIAKKLRAMASKERGQAGIVGPMPA